jgi:hypothetical protein
MKSGPDTLDKDCANINYLFPNFGNLLNFAVNK